MELCEAINHAREVAMQFNVCSGCRKEHNQLADWLEELAKLKDILGDDYDLDRLRELVEADRDGRCVVFKFGMDSTVYRTWVRPDGSCPFVSAQLIETVEDLVHAEKWSNAYATREEAEQELRGLLKMGRKEMVRNVSNLDTSPQATDLMEQSTMEENYE